MQLNGQSPIHRQVTKERMAEMAESRFGDYYVDALPDERRAMELVLIEEALEGNGAHEVVIEQQDSYDIFYPLTGGSIILPQEARLEGEGISGEIACADYASETEEGRKLAHIGYAALAIYPFGVALGAVTGSLLTKSFIGAAAGAFIVAGALANTLPETGVTFKDDSAIKELFDRLVSDEI